MKDAIKIKTTAYPLQNKQERLSALEKARGMWKNRKPDPIKELSKMRKEWDRNSQGYTYA